MSLENVQKKLRQFLENNTSCSVSETSEQEKTYRISNPWNDSSVAFDFNYDKIDDLALSLNPVILPERFSAIYHEDTKKLEVIWTAYKLPKNQQEVVGRSFTFELKKKKYKCEFGASSQKLIDIGKLAKPVTISETNHRNLTSFINHARLSKVKSNSSSFDEPRSFWISNVPRNEAEMLKVVQNLNFYLTYYDAQGPSILIHAPPTPDSKATQRTRYIDKEFPPHIDGKELDDTLLSFWYSAETGNPMMRFLLYYRILEYAAVHYVEAGAKIAIRKALNSPNARNNLDKVLDTVMAAVGSSKLSDAQRLQAVVRNCVDPELIWRELSANKDFFSKETKFDGGFSIGPVISAKDVADSYTTAKLDGLADTFRKIRNALSHGKDQETAGVIRPTSTNFRLFQTWLHLIATAAGEVVLYRGVAI